MEDKEIELLSKTIDIIREDVQRQIGEMKGDIKKLQEEYDAVLIEQRAIRLNQESAKKEELKHHRRIQLLIGVGAAAASAIPAILSLFHL